MRSFYALTIALAATCFVTSATAQEMPMAEPSEEHKVVMADVGTWEIKGKLIMGDQAEEFSGKEVITPIGGFWTISQYSAEMFGMPFHGSSTMGWDPKSKKYIGTWVDSMNPHATKMVGTFDKETQKMTFQTTGVGMDGQESQGKIEIVYNKDGSRTFSMFGADPTGGDGMVKMMEMTYTKKGGGSGSRGSSNK